MYKILWRHTDYSHVEDIEGTADYLTTLSVSF